MNVASRIVNWIIIVCLFAVLICGFIHNPDLLYAVLASMALILAVCGFVMFCQVGKDCAEEEKQNMK